MLLTQTSIRQKRCTSPPQPSLVLEIRLRSKTKSQSGSEKGLTCPFFAQAWSMARSPTKVSGMEKSSPASSMGSALLLPGTRSQIYAVQTRPCSKPWVFQRPRAMYYSQESLKEPKQQASNTRKTSASFRPEGKFLQIFYAIRSAAGGSYCLTKRPTILALPSLCRLVSQPLTPSPTRSGRKPSQGFGRKKEPPPRS